MNYLSDQDKQIEVQLGFNEIFFRIAQRTSILIIEQVRDHESRWDYIIIIQVRDIQCCWHSLTK